MWKFPLLEATGLINNPVICPCGGEVDKLSKCGQIGRVDCFHLELKLSSQEGEGINILTVKKEAM